MRVSVNTGWYLIAFLEELPGEITPLAIGEHRLIAVRDGDGVRVFHGTCPHRGAHLGMGGRLAGTCVVCPFHGKHIVLGDTSKHWAVREYPSAQWGQALFVRLGDDARGDRGFRKTLDRLSATHPLVPALTRSIAAPADLIVENAFDTDHFAALHKVSRVSGMHVAPGPDGELTIEGEFLMFTSPWQDEEAKARARWQGLTTGRVGYNYRARFFARAFSPALVVTEFGPPEDVHLIVTAAVPTGTVASRSCVARVAVGVRAGCEGILPMLIAGSHKALGEDIGIWENLQPDFTPRFDDRDTPVAEFQKFCTEFGQPS